MKFTNHAPVNQVFLIYLSMTQIWVWWTSHDTNLKQCMLTWKKWLYGWFFGS